MRRFQASGAPKLTPAEAERQGRITRVAIERLGAADAIAFLNGDHDRLADRPLRLAINSEEGLASVLALLDDRG